MASKVHLEDSDGYLVTSYTPGNSTSSGLFRRTSHAKKTSNTNRFDAAARSSPHLADFSDDDYDGYQCTSYDPSDSTKSGVFRRKSERKEKNRFDSRDDDEIQSRGDPSAGPSSYNFDDDGYICTFFDPTTSSTLTATSDGFLPPDIETKSAWEADSDDFNISRGFDPSTVGECPLYSRAEEKSDELPRKRQHDSNDSDAVGSATYRYCEVEIDNGDTCTARNMSLTSKLMFGSVKRPRIVENQATIPSPSKNPANSSTLPNHEQLKVRNVEEFLKSLKATYNFRKTSKKTTIDHGHLPNLEDVVDAFKKLTKSDSCGMIQQMRIGGVQLSTVQCAAASTIYFLSYIKAENVRQFEQCTDSKSGFTYSVVEKMRAMSVAEKANIICGFVIWYESIPSARFSNIKLFCTNFELERASCKENSTMKTVARGILAFLTYVGVIAPSTNKHQTDESNAIWNALNSVQKVGELRKCGTLDSITGSICVQDMMVLMNKSEGVSSTFQLQSWLLALVLSGTGLRISSVRQACERIPLRNSTSSLTQPHIIKSGESGAVGAEEDCDTLQIDFVALTANDVHVYRVAKQKPEEHCRLFVTLKVYHSKTTGHNLYRPQILGFNYPNLRSDGTEVWGIGTAFALAILSVLAGSTDMTKLVSDEFEPTKSEKIQISDNSGSKVPLFRSSDCHHRMFAEPMRNVTNSISTFASTLGIPASVYTTKSCRKGFARSTLMNVVSCGDPKRVVPLQELRDALFTSARWRSAQADRYIGDVARNVMRAPTTSTGITATDWLVAAIRSSPLAKLKSYNHVKMESLTEYVKREMSDEAVTRLRTMTHNQKAELMDMINLKNWDNAQESAISGEEFEAQCINDRIIDVPATLCRLEEFLASDVNFAPFSGFGRSQRKAPYTCPVVDCWETCGDVATANQHWEVEHRGRELKAKLICWDCEDSQPTTWRSYQNHLCTTHDKLRSKFNWIYKH